MSGWVTVDFHPKYYILLPYKVLCFPGGSVVKNPPANAREAGNADSVPGLGRSPGERNVNPPQFSCLGILMDRGGWWAIVSMALQKSYIQPSDWAHPHIEY